MISQQEKALVPANPKPSQYNRQWCVATGTHTGSVLSPWPIILWGISSFLPRLVFAFFSTFFSRSLVAVRKVFPVDSGSWVWDDVTHWKQLHTLCSTLWPLDITASHAPFTVPDGRLPISGKCQRFLSSFSPSNVSYLQYDQLPNGLFLKLRMNHNGYR